MSDISLNFTWWQIALWMLVMAFWPLTLIASGAVYWWWRQRRSWPARITAIVFVVLWLVSAGSKIVILADQAKNQADYRSDLHSRQRTLAQSTVIHGIHLPAKTVVTSDQTDPNELAAVDLPSPTTINSIPLVGHVGFSGGDLDGTMTLAHDAHIGTAFCSAQAPVRFVSGKLVECGLAKPSPIGGIPCSGAINLENGVVCTLAATYSRYGYVWRPQTKVTDYGDLVWFHIGSLAPSMRLFGTTLPPDSEVQFNHGRIASVDLRNNPVHFRGCAFDLIMVQDGKTMGRSTGACTLHEAPGSLYVALPSTAIGKAT